MFDKIITFMYDLRDRISLSKIGAVGAHLRYGQVKGGKVNVGGFLWAASQVVKNKGGKFVFLNAGALTLCVDGSTQVIGWANEYERTPTAGDKVTVNLALDAVFRIPIISGTFVEGMRGDTCDIENGTSKEGATTVQGAKLDGVGETLLIIVDGDLVNNYWVDVMRNPYPANAKTLADA